MKSAFRKLVAAAALLLASTSARSATVGGLRARDDVCTLRTVERSEATTQSCLSCHDGTVAGGHAGFGSGEHPLDVSYDVAASRNLRFRARFEVSRRILLPGGKITCISCHDGASDEPKHTAMTMSRGTLCTSCHAM
jgi:predicted CXXCH cytochrome family protein